MKKLLFLLFIICLLASCTVNKDGYKTVVIGKYEYFGGNAAKFKMKEKNKAEKKRLHELSNPVVTK